MVMAIHLKLVTPYLSSGKQIKLPSMVGRAEDYADWDTDTNSERPLWKRFREADGLLPE